MNTPANVTIVALFALLLQACDVPTLRQYDFSDTPEDVVSEAFQLYAIGPRAIDKAAFSEHINTRMKLHESDLLGYFKKNHLTCELNGPNFTCKHRMIWKINLQDSYAKCDNPTEDPRVCIATNLTTLEISTKPSPAVISFKFSSN
jgi:hypothetical protein